MTRRRNIQLIPFLIAISLLSFASCGKSNGSSSSSNASNPGLTLHVSPGNVKLGWNPNHESGVNATGGGYHVLYSPTVSFPTSSTTTIELPYSSGASAPTSTVIPNVSGTVYVKVIAYSSANPSGSATQLTLLTQ